jgi:antitoxin PrlF
MRLTSKGQVTIPIDVRYFLGLQPGDEVEFVIERDIVQVHRSPHSRPRGRRVVEHLLKHQADVPMTTAEIMALTRDD